MTLSDPTAPLARNDRRAVAVVRGIIAANRVDAAPTLFRLHYSAPGELARVERVEPVESGDHLTG